MNIKWAIIGVVVGLALAVIMLQQGALALVFAAGIGAFGVLGYQAWRR